MTLWTIFALVEGHDKCVPKVKVYASLDHSKNEDIFVVCVYMYMLVFSDLAGSTMSDDILCFKKNYKKTPKFNIPRCFISW